MTESTITATYRFPPGEPSVPLYIALLGGGGQTDLVNGDGSVVLGYGATGDAPPGGFEGEASSGPVEYVNYEGGTICPWKGVRITADALVDIHHVGGYGGVRSRWIDTSITVQIRQNGLVINDQTYTVVADAPGGYDGFFGGFTFALTDIVVAVGDEFEISFYFIGAPAFAYYAAMPGAHNAGAHFRVSGNTIPHVQQFLRGHVAFAAEMAGGW